MGKTNHLFILGERYRNRKGDYVVIAFHGDTKMTIRYDDGTEQLVKIATQLRIWQSIQDERQQEIDEKQDEYDRSRQRIEFNGFGDVDFTGNVGGTSWRSQHSLGGLLALQLSEKHGREFTSYSVYRRPQVFVYPVGLVDEPGYREMAPVPKLYVSTDQTAVRWGIYIEKSDTPMGNDWHWPCLLAYLQTEQGQKAVERLTTDGLEVSLGLEKREHVDSEIYKAAGTITLAELVIENGAPPHEALLSYLAQLPDDVWCNLYICQTMSKEKAIASGVGIAKEIGGTFSNLLPFYLALLA